MTNEGEMLIRYLQLRLDEGKGHREASREAGYAYGASRSAQRAYKFILSVKAGRKARTTNVEEVQLWLIAKLRMLTAKSKEIRAEIAEIKLNIKSIELMRELED
jgi:hypothetical protein